MSKKKVDSIILIIPYFGKFPNYFNLFLASAGKNKTIDFLFITDDHTDYNYPKNTKVIYETFDNIKLLFNNYFLNNFGIDVKFDRPYKLCDYRPFYNCIFKQYVSGYDYVGWCDVDTILGDLRKYLNEINFCSYKKIFAGGHFSLIHNDDFIANLLVNAGTSDYYYTFRECVFMNEHTIHFDEYNGINRILYIYGYDMYQNYDVIADLNFLKRNFYLLNDDFTSENVKWIFKYINGSLYGINEFGEEREFMYVHLQKRTMEFSNVFTNYYIIPNKFVDIDDFSIENYFDTIDDDFDLPSTFVKSNFDFDFTKDYVINFINENFYLFLKMIVDNNMKL